jgi:hypothetical protein
MLVLCVLPTTAQIDAATAASSDGDHSLKTLSGCLRQDETQTQFKLLAEEGGVWTLQSDDPALGSYRGRTVSIMGVVDNQEASTRSSEREDRQSQLAQSKRLIVLNVEKLSDGCQIDVPVR